MSQRGQQDNNILCYSYHAFSYILYINQQVNLIKYNKIQFVISINSHMFQYQSAIQRGSTKTQEPKSNMPIHVLIPPPYLNWCVGLVFLCFSRLPEDGTLVLKHMGVNTDH